MKFHILSLFPEMIENGLKHSIIGRGIDKDILQINNIDIRDFSKNKHKKVDDYPFGGGAGMLMTPQPIYDAFSSIKNQISEETPVIYVTPQGRTFNQKIAHELAAKDDIVILCGHYEGVDERVLELICTDYISVGDYVLTGGELPAMIIVDSVSRLVPDVLHSEESYMDESFERGLLEYPQYTRPAEFMGKKVPEVLLSGHHANIEKYRLEESKKRTKERRPDLYKKYIEIDKN